MIFRSHRPAIEMLEPRMLLIASYENLCLFSPEDVGLCPHLSLQQVAIRRLSQSQSQESVVYDQKKQLLDRFRIEHDPSQEASAGEEVTLSFYQAGPFTSPPWPQASARKDYPAGIHLEWSFKDIGLRTIADGDITYPILPSTTGSDFDKTIQLPAVADIGIYTLSLRVSIVDGSGSVLHRAVKNSEGQSSEQDLTELIQLTLYTGCDVPNNTRIPDVILPKIVTEITSSGLVVSKRLDMRFDEVGIDFTTEEVDDSEQFVCQARSDVAALPVALDLYTRLNLTGDERSTELPIRGKSVGQALVQLIDGPNQMVRWSNGEGFRPSLVVDLPGDSYEIDFGLLGDAAQWLWQFTGDFNLEDIEPGLHYPESSFDTILRKAEDYIHRFLSEKWFGILRKVDLFLDPGQTSMLVADSSGRRTGKLPNETLVHEIPNSVYIPEGPIVLIFGSSPGQYETQIAGLSTGAFEFTVGNLDLGHAEWGPNFVVATSIGMQSVFTSEASAGQVPPSLNLRSTESISADSIQLIDVSEGRILELVNSGPDSRLRAINGNSLDERIEGRQVAVTLAGANSKLVYSVESQGNLADVALAGSGSLSTLEIPSSTTIDLTASSSPHLFSFGNIKLDSQLGSTLILDSQAVRKLSTGLQEPIHIRRSVASKIDFQDMSSWSLESAAIDGRDVRVTIGNGSERVDVSSEARAQNPLNNLDVNNDKLVTPADALNVLTFLNDTSSSIEGRYDSLPEVGSVGWAFRDTNGNRLISPVDALLVINLLNDRTQLSQITSGEHPYVAGYYGSLDANPAKGPNDVLANLLPTEYKGTNQRQDPSEGERELRRQNGLQAQNNNTMRDALFDISGLGALEFDNLSDGFVDVDLVALGKQELTMSA